MNGQESGMKEASALFQADAVRRPSGLMAGVWKLLRLRARIEVVEFAHSKPGFKVFNAFAYLFFILIVAVITTACWVLFFLFRSAGLADILGLRETPILLLSMALGFSLPSSFALLVQEFLLAKDLPFLLSLPIPVRSVLASKIIAAAMPGMAMFGLFYIPYLAAMGHSFGYSPLFFAALMVPLAAIFLAVSALSSLLVLLAARFLSLRAIWSALIGLFLIALATAVLLQPRQSHSEWGSFDLAQIQPILRLARLADMPYSPLAWAGRGLVTLGENQVLWGAAQMAPLLLLCAAVFFVFLFVGERIYLEGITRLTKTLGRRRPAFRLPARIGAWLTGRIPRSVRPIVVKDLRFFLRDLQYMSVLFVPILMGGMALLSLLRVQGGDLPAAETEPLDLPLRVERFLDLLLVFLPLMLTYMMSAVFGAFLLVPLISLEGRSFWILRSSPVSPAQFLAAKYWVGLIAIVPFYHLFTLLFQLLLGGVYARWDLALYAHATQALTLAALAALYLSLGASQARFDWLHPGKLFNVTTQFSTVGGGLLVACAGTLFYLAPAGLYAFELHYALALTIGLLSGGLFCALVIRWQLRRAGRRVAALFRGE